MSLLECVCCPRHKHRAAVVWDDLEVPSVQSYAFLLERSTQIACHLRHLQARLPLSQKGKVIVGLYGNNNPEVLAALLGILAVPAAYVPVDLSQPTWTRRETLKRLGVCFILIHELLLEDFLSQEWPPSTNIHLDTGMVELGLVTAFLDWRGAYPLTVSFLSWSPNQDEMTCSGMIMCPRCTEISEGIAASHSMEEEGETRILASYEEELHFDCCLCPQENSSFSFEKISTVWSFPHTLPTSLAYILHTSGTTGLPKAVRVPHCCIVPNVVDLKKRLSISDDDIVFNAAPLTFDPSVAEIFMALSCGATLLMVPNRVKKSQSYLARVLFQRQYATVLQATPALVQRWTEESIREKLLGGRSHVRVLAFGGEACPNLSLLAKWKHPQNKTKIFNLYGTTEVSSWATCHEIPNADLYTAADSAEQLPAPAEGEHALPDQVPVGEPLMGTELEVRNKDGAVVRQGFGEIWIGGRYRVCLLEGEESLMFGCMRATGDWGHVTDGGKVVFMGRCDRQLKRSGHRVNLDSIQQMVQMLEVVSNCAVASISKAVLQESQLRRYISPRAFQGTEDILVAFVVPREGAVGVMSTRELTLSLLSALRELLPSYSIPDEVVLMKELPTNDHGKTDVKALTNCTCSDLIYLHPPTDITMSPHKLLTLTQIKDSLLSLAYRLLGFKVWPEHKCILDLGANSFDVVRLSNHYEIEMLSTMGRIPNLPQLVECLLTRTLNEVALYIEESLCSQHGQDSEAVVAGGPSQTGKRGRKHTGTLEEPPGKRQRELEATGNGIQCISWRRGHCFVNGRPRLISLDPNMQGDSTPLTGVKCSFKTKWSVNTGKCVDASPLVVQRNSQPPVVYVGSHSGLLLAVDFHSGAVLWKVQLGDRIESSACVSCSGEYVIVGCYDGCVYTVQAATGDVHWCFKASQEPVKSSPCVDPATGLVWFGSHDQHLYGIDVQRKAVVHKLFLDGGSCFSSPCINAEERTLYCATLQGRVAAVDLENGVVKWVFGCPKPVFSSPLLLPNGSVAVGCVDSCVYIINSKGKMISKLSSGKPIFSSCCVLLEEQNTYTVQHAHRSNSGMSARANTTLNLQQKPVNELQESDFPQWKMYCGSHDRGVYCWNERLELEWRAELDSEVYSTPFLLSLPLSIHNHHEPTASEQQGRSTVMITCLCVCSTAGFMYLLDARRGGILGTCELPQDVFSSPVGVDNQLAVGCRDDRVYCLEVTLFQIKAL